MKCDMCYDRTSVGKRPMCATVCPSEALYFGTMEEWQKRRRGNAVNTWTFGKQTVTTKVYMVMPETEANARKEASVQTRQPVGRIDIRLENVRTIDRKESIG